MASYYLSLHERDPPALYIHDMDVTVEEGFERELATIQSVDEWTRWCKRTLRSGHDRIFCSSSLDFPAEYTSVQEIVDLCNHIRGNSVELPPDQPHWR